MKPKGSLLPLLCILAASLALPAGANAKAGPEVHPGRYLLTIELPDSDGWEVRILAYDHRDVYLQAERGAASVSYRAPGHVSSRRLEADFGSLGRIDLKLDLQARGTGVPRLHGRCTGRSPYELFGRFHGTVDFPGESQVVSVSAKRGRAAILRTFQHVCQPLPELGGQSNGPFQIGADVLAARTHENGRTTAVTALDISLGGEFFLGLIAGSVNERSGQVAIARTRKGLIFEEKEMRISSPGTKPEQVHLKPGPPFLGKASYSKSPKEPPQWSGDLRVAVPGGGVLSLAGPNFASGLCRLHSVAEFAACATRLRDVGAGPDVLDLYGSGSHSQPLALARLSSLR
jgi:hypothetical protein